MRVHKAMQRRGDIVATMPQVETGEGWSMNKRKLEIVYAIKRNCERFRSLVEKK